MRTTKTTLECFAAAAFFCAGAAMAQDKTLPKTASDAEYRISTGDVLQITVYQVPELSRTIVVPQDGNITLPPVTVVKAVGLSPMALASLLRDKLQSAVPDAQVTVTVKIHHPPVPLRREPWPRDITPPKHQGQSES